jgi:hypothetical protein
MLAYANNYIDDSTYELIPTQSSCDFLQAQSKVYLPPTKDMISEMIRWDNLIFFWDGNQLKSRTNNTQEEISDAENDNTSEQESSVDSIHDIDSQAYNKLTYSKSDTSIEEQFDIDELEFVNFNVDEEDDEEDIDFEMNSEELVRRQDAANSLKRDSSNSGDVGTTPNKIRKV